jgi:alkaline phosphatase D
MKQRKNPVPRRAFLQQTAVSTASMAGLAGILKSGRAPAQIVSDAHRPLAPWGLQVGDVLMDRAMIWSRSDADARMLVEWSCHENFRDSVQVRGPYALESTDHTARVDLTGLPSDSDVFVRVLFEGLDSTPASSEPLHAHFRTAPSRSRDLRLLWSGDTAGQGWGIDLNWGGMRTYEAMRLTEPDFFIHCGDNIYADGPMSPTVLDEGGNVIWTNAFLDEVPEKTAVAQTLHDFRRAYLYNRYDENVQRFTADVPQIWQWDDHEVVNNWSASKVLDDRYSPDTNVFQLAANATRAFMEYAPLRWHSQEDSERVYRRVPYGPDLDVFVLDMRSYRGPNTCNDQDMPGAETVFLGQAQIRWLKEQLAASTATWKVIASDMPIGLVVGDGRDPETGCPRGENSSNGDGPVRGREFEIAEVLSFIKQVDVANVVWITADVHYTAAHYYDPDVAQFSDFKPFWEFVSGPLNAGTFGPNALDNTFGPTVIFEMAPPPGQANLPPSAGLQFFGQIDIDCRSREMTVSLKNVDGNEVFSKVLEPERAGRHRRRRAW